MCSMGYGWPASAALTYLAVRIPQQSCSRRSVTAACSIAQGSTS